MTIVDVRSADEYSAGHVPGARNFPLDSIESEIPGFHHKDPLVIVCRTGVRSESACKKLMGTHDNLFNLVGGTSAWLEAGLPIER